MLEVGNMSSCDVPDKHQNTKIGNLATRAVLKMMKGTTTDGRSRWASEFDVDGQLLG